MHLNLALHSVCSCSLLTSAVPAEVHIMSFIQLLSVVCLILFVANPSCSHSSGARDESCDSLTVIHTHLGETEPGTPCGQDPCRSHQLRLIDSSDADTFVYDCGQTYQCELKYINTDHMPPSQWDLLYWIT